MNTERINELEKLITEDPDEPFLRYALALEWSSSDQHRDKAIHLLCDLRDTHPGYLPLYYQLATLFFKAGDTDSAQLVARMGLDLAVKLNNRHTAAELEFLLEDVSGE